MESHAYHVRLGVRLSWCYACQRPVDRLRRLLALAVSRGDRVTQLIVTGRLAAL